MNRKQRRITKAQDKPKVVLNIRGKTCTLAEAVALAMEEYNTKNYQAAVDIFQLIIEKVPEYVDAHNNRGNVLQTMGRYNEALANYNNTIALKPDYALAYNNRGITLQALGRYDEALVSYDKAIALMPTHAEAHNNKGYTLLQLARFPEALASCDQALALKTAYAEAHNNRGFALLEMNRLPEAVESYDKAIALKADYALAYTNRGAALQKMKRYSDALASYDKAITLSPTSSAPYNNRGTVLHAMQRYEDALSSYAKAGALNPADASVYSNKSDTLLKLARYDEALASCSKAIALNPGYANSYCNQGNVLQEQKRYDEAVASYRKAISLDPGFAKVYYNLGNTLVSKGDMVEGEAMFRKAIEVNPAFAAALFNLVHIIKYKDANDPEIANIQRLLGTPGTSPQDREYLYFALGKIFDDCKRYDDAFECYRQANELRNRRVSYNARAAEDMASRIKEVFSKDFLAQASPFGSDNSSPVFVVGMPRSGTTLMTTILSKHPGVASAGELPTIADCIAQLAGHGVTYPEAAKHMTPAIAASLVAMYEKRQRRDIAMDIPYIIDKHPLNFTHLGFISTLFPKAKIIHCTRNAFDTGLSNYFQRFPLSYDYCFSLSNIGHFYKLYEKIMEHWRQSLPIRMVEIDYEDMVTNTEQAARNALDLLGLEWDDRCLTPHTNTHAVETASSWQVRQPIYKQSLARWQHYEKHLQPLKDCL